MTKHTAETDKAKEHARYERSAKSFNSDKFGKYQSEKFGCSSNSFGCESPILFMREY